MGCCLQARPDCRCYCCSCCCRCCCVACLLAHQLPRLLLPQQQRMGLQQHGCCCHGRAGHICCRPAQQLSSEGSWGPAHRAVCGSAPSSTGVWAIAGQPPRHQHPIGRSKGRPRGCWVQSHAKCPRTERGQPGSGTTPCLGQQRHAESLARKYHPTQLSERQYGRCDCPAPRGWLFIGSSTDAALQQQQRFQGPPVQAWSVAHVLQPARHICTRSVSIVAELLPHVEVR
jgi:hypothetical protein